MDETMTFKMTRTFEGFAATIDIASEGAFGTWRLGWEYRRRGAMCLEIRIHRALIGAGTVWGQVGRQNHVLARGEQIGWH